MAGRNVWVDQADDMLAWAAWQQSVEQSLERAELEQAEEDG